MPWGPPWISRISGYFREGSKEGGLTTQPCTLAPPLEVYQSSSTSPSRVPLNRSALTSVSCSSWAGRLSSKRTISVGRDALLRTANTMPLLVTAALLMGWVPVGTWLAADPMGRDQRLLVPRSAAVK